MKSNQIKGFIDGFRNQELPKMNLDSFKVKESYDTIQHVLRKYYYDDLNRLVVNYNIWDNLPTTWTIYTYEGTSDLKSMEIYSNGKVIMYEYDSSKILTSFISLLYFDKENVIDCEYFRIYINGNKKVIKHTGEIITPSGKRFNNKIDLYKHNNCKSPYKFYWDLEFLKEMNKINSIVKWDMNNKYHIAKSNWEREFFN